MPELPEVETVCRDLRHANLFGKPIVDVEVLRPQNISLFSPAQFKQRLIGRHIVEISRQGKYIDMHLDDQSHLITHLRMTGSYHVQQHTYQHTSHDRVRFLFPTQLLVYRDVRAFGRLYLSEDVNKFYAHLGYEPFDATLDGALFWQLLQSRRTKIKPLLLSQNPLVGLGNIYSDEALFKAAINPHRPANSLTQKEAHRLLEAIRLVLGQAIDQRGTSLGDGVSEFVSGGYTGEYYHQLQVYGRGGQACLHCATQLRKERLNQRTTVYCPQCQK